MTKTFEDATTTAAAGEMTEAELATVSAGDTNTTSMAMVLSTCLRILEDTSRIIVGNMR